MELNYPSSSYGLAKFTKVLLKNMYKSHFKECQKEFSSHLDDL